MKKKEASFNTIFNKYLRAKGIHCYYEVKQTEGNFNLNSFEPQQLSSLISAQQNGLVYKFSDADMRLKPFDGGSFPPLPAYVVVKFPHSFYMIPIDAIMRVKGDFFRKSLTLSECMLMAAYNCTL